MQTLLSDTQISLRKLSTGDSTAFWELWLPHQSYLYHCCLKWMDNNETDAQDALSQVMLKAWDKLPLHAEKIINLKAWLTRFSYHLCIDLHREGGRKKIGMDSPELPASDLLSTEMKMKIHFEVDALPLRLRSPFKMRFEQDVSCLDIARKLGLSIDNVYKRLSQARAILKPQMQKHLSEEDDSNHLEISLLLINQQESTAANLNKGIQQNLLPMLTQGKAGSEALHNQRMQCVYCQSIHTCRNGHRRGKQNYLCQQCDRQFVDSCAFKGYPLKVKERCLKLHTQGTGYRAIGRETGVCHNTVANWVRQDATS